MVGNGEALLLHTVYKKLNFYYKSRKCPYQVLQVTWKTCISTTSHVRICVRYCKSRTLQLNMQCGSYGKIIITIVSSYTGKNITCSLPLIGIVNTDGNKLTVYSGIALYCGDNYCQVP